MVSSDLLELAAKDKGEDRQRYVTSPAVDPYLVWAVLSNFRGFEAEPVNREEPKKKWQLVGKSAVTVESLDGWQPWSSRITLAQQCLAGLISPNSSAPRRENDPYQIYAIGGNATSQGAVYTGQLLASDLGHLVQMDCENKDLNHLPRWRIEFNQARTDDRTSLSGPTSATAYAKRPELKKAVIAIIDHGCPFAHPQFRAQTGDARGHMRTWETRVKLLWDQDLRKTVGFPQGDIQYERDNGQHWWGVNDFFYGRELTAEDMNRLIGKHYDAQTGQIDEAAIYRLADYKTLEDRSTHGAGVMDMAAGAINPRTCQRDAGSNADILFVQLPRDSVADTSGSSMTRYVLDALKYIFKHTAKVDHLAINLSFGSTAGPHDGSSLLERAMDELILQERTAYPSRKLELFLPAGNHYLAKAHAAVKAGGGVRDDKEKPSLHWVLLPDDRTDNFLELWCPRDKHIAVRVVSPSGRASPWSKGINTAQELWAAQMEEHLSDDANSPRLLRLNESTPPIGAIIQKQEVAIGLGQVVLLALGPTHRDSWSRVEHGVWRVEIDSNEPVAFDVNAWVERDDALVAGWRQPQSFLLDARTSPRLQEDEDKSADILRRRGTGNSLANGKFPIVVGAEVASTGRPTDYTAAAVDPSTGSLVASGTGWPDWSAPADESESFSGLLVAGTRSGTLVRMNGSSVAAPQVARAYINAWSEGKAEPVPISALPNLVNPPATVGRVGRRRLRSNGECRPQFAS